jgi:hypothetical protein
MIGRSRWGRRAAIASGTAHVDRRSAPSAARAFEALAAHQHLTAAGLLALLVLAYLWPVLVGGDILAPTANLFRAPPWLAGATPRELAYFQPQLADVVGTYYPWAVLVRRLIHSATFPAWNPYAFAGTPLFANSQLAWLSPFSLPLWILPLNYGLGVAAALKLWVAGFGAYLLCRELRLTFWPALLAGVGYALCAFNIVWLTYGIFVSVAAMLPWALWLTERIVRRGRAVDALALTAVVALVQAGGHPGTQLHVLLAVCLYALVRALAVPGRERRERLRALGLVGGALALGTLILAVVLLPAQEAAHDTFGAAVRRNGAPGLRGSHVPASALRTALFPDWWGRPSEQLEGGVATYKDRTLYVGTASLIFAVIALVSPGRWRVKAPFVLLGALGPLVALRAPLLYPAIIHLPLLNAVQNQRIVLLYELAVVVLAAFGLQATLDALRSRRWPVVVALAVLAGLIAAATAGGSTTAGDVARQMLRRADAEVEPLSAGTVALASVGWWLGLALAVGAVLALARLRPRWRMPVAGLIVLLLAFDMLHFAHGFNPMGPASEIVPRPTGAIRYLRSHAGDRRIAGVGFTLETDWPTVYGLADVRGRDAPQPSLRFARLWLALDQLEVATIRRFDAASVNVLGLLGARLLLVDPEVDLTTRDVKVAYSGPDAAVFANRRAVPRAFVPATVHVAGDELHELRTLFRASFDPRRAAVVRRDELGAAGIPRGGVGTARVVHEENDRVLLEARLDRRGVVVLDDQLTPGWSVRVDGRPASALHVDAVLRGVRVPAGSHDVEWSYRVPGLRVGAVLSLVGLLIALAWAYVIRARGRARDLRGSSDRPELPMRSV